MAKSLNKVMLIGNLGKDPELRFTSSGVPVATFTIATNESWKDQEGNLQERTEWHNIVAWRKLAEICGEWLKKGKKVYIEGKIQTRSYDDKNTGAKKYMTEIVADSLIMLDGKSAGASAEGPAAPSAPEPAPGGASNDDLPF
ncbi:MAG TPA: single-stranded DNA-binding protein [Bacteroidota bacterium]|jgi:single-strand DNA-binding protein|nr:single-stranded DNA-binding protein [Bacteroidota bacterium]